MNKYEEALEEVLENGGYLDNGKDDYKAPKLLREAIKGNNALQRMYEAGITYDSVRALKQERDDALNHIKELENSAKDGTLSDGYHTFNDLYYQRCVLFANIVNQNADKAWKSYKHEDGELCFGGRWFIVGVDTPEGSYTYHYENKYWDLFKCKELEYAKHWDGHTDKDVTRLLTLEYTPSEKSDFVEVGIEKYDKVINTFNRIGVMTLRKSRIISIKRVCYDIRPAIYYYYINYDDGKDGKTYIVDEFNYNIIMGRIPCKEE